MAPRPTLERWRTAITLVEPNRIVHRGRPLEELIESWSFPAAIWLLLQGTEPTADREDALRRVLVAACDHGLAAPSIAAARTVASTRGAPGVAIATGLLAFSGPAHGGAASACAAVLAEIGSAATEGDVRDFVAHRLGAGVRLPGFGHPYHERDPRVPGLLEAPLTGDAWRRLVRLVEQELVAAKGPRLHMNADAAVAALLLDAGMPAATIDLVTLIGRCVGLAAHVTEELQNEAPFRAPSLGSIEYVPPETA
jgi:citrate synthase